MKLPLYLLVHVLLWISPLLGIPGILGAALGFVAVFASATNTWFAPMIIAWEIFDFNVFIPAILVVTFSFFQILIIQFILLYCQKAV